MTRGGAVGGARAAEKDAERSRAPDGPSEPRNSPASKTTVPSNFSVLRAQHLRIQSVHSNGTFSEKPALTAQAKAAPRPLPVTFFKYHLPLPETLLLISCSFILQLSPLELNSKRAARLSASFPAESSVGVQLVLNERMSERMNELNFSGAAGNEAREARREGP